MSHIAIFDNRLSMFRIQTQGTQSTFPGEITGSYYQLLPFHVMTMPPSPGEGGLGCHLLDAHTRSRPNLLTVANTSPH